MVTFIDKSSMQGKEIRYGLVELVYGRTLLGIFGDQLCYLGFSDCDIDSLADLRGRWQGVEFSAISEDQLRPWQVLLDDFCNGVIDSSAIDLLISGSDFDQRVWGELLKISRGSTSTYSALASSIGSHGVRAVGSSVGRNPISLVVPCHRVLRSNGELGGYYWGIDKKSAILQGEGAK